MIIIPELKSVLITPPRTASTSIRVAILNRWEEAFAPHHHMEAIGVPPAYGTWDTYCTIRHPYERLHSLYRYMRTYVNPDTDQNWIEQMRADTNRSFEDWLMNSNEVFTEPHIGKAQYDHRYAVRMVKPIVNKSVSDFGFGCRSRVNYLPIEQKEAIEAQFDVKLDHINASVPSDLPEITPRVAKRLEIFHEFDCVFYGYTPWKADVGL